MTYLLAIGLSGACAGEPATIRTSPPTQSRQSMSEDTFWRLIDQARAGSSQVRDQARALHALLEPLPPESLQAFDSYAWGYFSALDRKELWAAADTIMGGCSDDSFDYFREWLILQGKRVVLGAVHDPDSLADLPLAERPGTEHLLSLAREVYQTKLGHEMPDDASTFRVDETGWPADRVQDYKWTEETTRRLFPRLTARAAWKQWY